MRKKVFTIVTAIVILLGFYTLGENNFSVAADRSAESRLSLTNTSHLLALNEKLIKAKFEVEKAKKEAEQKAKKEKQEETPLFITPAKGRLTSEFGYRIHPIFGEKQFHKGIDLAKGGKVEILAAADGVVTKSEVLGGYGQVIMIEHEIDGEVYETVYAHLRDKSGKVSVGDKVKQGQVIGLKGNTGNSTGQHLHFEIHEGKWKKGQPNAVDPLEYIEVM